MSYPKQFIISLFLLNLLITPHYSVSVPPHTHELVYKGCANQKFQDPSGEFSQNLHNLFDTLVSQSLSTKFYNTTTGQGLSAINGLFQCRADLNASDCKECVSQTPIMAQKLCGDNVIAARVQLEGCYLRYEVAGFKQASPIELLYKTCGSTQVRGAGCQQTLDTALGEMAKEIGGDGFYSGGYQSVSLVGECEGGDMWAHEDCVNCLKAAGEKAKNECGNSISGQIYLQKCQISFNVNGDHTNPCPSSGRNPQSTQKTVAIVGGGIIIVVLLFSTCLYARSVYNKRRCQTKYGGGGHF